MAGTSSGGAGTRISRTPNFGARGLQRLVRQRKAFLRRVKAPNGGLLPGGALWGGPCGQRTQVQEGGPPPDLFLVEAGWPQSDGGRIDIRVVSAPKRPEARTRADALRH